MLKALQKAFVMKEDYPPTTCSSKEEQLIEEKGESKDICHGQPKTNKEELYTDLTDKVINPPGNRLSNWLILF